MLTASLAGAQAPTSATPGPSTANSTSDSRPNSDEGSRITVWNDSGKDIQVANTWGDFAAGPVTLHPNVGEKYVATGVGGRQAVSANGNGAACLYGNEEAGVTLGSGYFFGTDGIYGDGSGLSIGKFKMWNPVQSSFFGGDSAATSLFVRGDQAYWVQKTETLQNLTYQYKYVGVQDGWKSWEIVIKSFNP